jgi:hypothetical protein
MIACLDRFQAASTAEQHRPARDCELAGVVCVAPDADQVTTSGSLRPVRVSICASSRAIRISGCMASWVSR